MPGTAIRTAAPRLVLQCGTRRDGLNLSTDQPINRSTDQPINRSTDQPINRSTDGRPGAAAERAADLEPMATGRPGPGTALVDAPD